MKVRYSYLSQQFGDCKDLWQNLKKFVKTGDFTLGKELLKFEKKFAKLIGTKYAVGVNSGTDAIKLSLKVIGIKPGDEVITAANTFVATVGAICELGAKPVFVDCDDSFCMDVKMIEEKITKKTKAILVPNLIGNLPNWKKIKIIAKKYKLKIIEDSADTLGGRIYNKPSGFYSDISITSFYGSHLISCAGNGGIFLTNNKNYFMRAKVLRSWGRMSTLIKDSENIHKRLNIRLHGFEYDRKFVFSEAGYNFEPSEIGASFGLEQLKKFKFFEKIRNRNFNLHYKFFKKLNNYFITPKIYKSVKTNFLAYPIILREKLNFSRKELQIYLEKQNIQTRPIFTGNTLRHPGFKSLISKKNRPNKFKNSDYIMKNGLLIGCHQGLSPEDISYIHSKILNFKKIK